jgi:hypothetical protein
MKALRKITSFLYSWPTIWAIPVFALLYIYSFPAVDFINELATEMSGGQPVEFSASFFQVILAGIFVAIVCGDLAQLGIGAQAPWIFKYLLNQKLCADDFLSISAGSRQWLLFAYLALFMFVLSQFAG